MAKSACTNKNCQENCKYSKVVLYLRNNKQKIPSSTTPIYLTTKSPELVFHSILQHKRRAQQYKSEKTEMLSGHNVSPPVKHVI